MPGSARHGARRSAHPRLHPARLRGPGHPDLRVPRGRGDQGREHPRPDAIRVMPPFVPEPGERGDGFGAPPWPTPPGRRAPTGAGSSTSTTPGARRASPSTPAIRRAWRCLKDLVARLRRRDRELRRGHPRPLGPRLRRHARPSGPTSSTCRCAGSATRAPTPST